MNRDALVAMLSALLLLAGCALLTVTLVLPHHRVAPLLAFAGIAYALRQLWPPGPPPPPPGAPATEPERLPPPDLARQARRLRIEGLSLKAIALRLRVSERAVRRALLRSLRGSWC